MIHALRVLRALRLEADLQEAAVAYGQALSAGCVWKYDATKKVGETTLIVI